MSLNSATVADNDDATAAQYNNLRKDVVQKGGDYATSSGSANAYILAVDTQIVTAYVEGTTFKFKANFTNTGPATLNVNSLGAKTIKKFGGANDLEYGEILNGQVVEVLYDGTNLQLLSQISLKGVVELMVAGEIIDASSTPKALYLKEIDGKVYNLNSTSATEAAFAFVGFAIIQSSVSVNGNIRVQTAGIVSGFSALTVGEYYYGTNIAGTINTTAGTKSLQIGRAITATTLLIQIGKKVANGQKTFFSTSSQAITLGFKPSVIRIYAFGASNIHSMGSWNYSTGDLCQSCDNAGSPFGSNTVSWFIWNNGGAGNNGTITSVTSTGFTLSNIKTGAAPDANLFWEAEG